MKPNDVIHQSTRLRIMAALNVLEARDWIEFTRLRSLVEATDGNLGAHLETLARAGYVTIDKRFAGKKPQTRVRATNAGKRAFGDHVDYLRSLLNEPFSSKDRAPA